MIKYECEIKNWLQSTIRIAKMLRERKLIANDRFLSDISDFRKWYPDHNNFIDDCLKEK